MSPGMVPCRVEWHGPALLVTLDDGRDILLQSDWDQVAFCVNCGLFTSEQLEHYNGSPSDLGDAWVDCDPTLIEACPEEYAELEEA
jgi:hypothetical protein